MMNMGQGMTSSCSKLEVKKAGDKIVSESDCKMGKSRMVSRTVFTGDFSRAYSAVTTTTFDPPMMGMSSSESKVTARWVGACKAGQKPGDIITPDGTKMNISDIMNFGG